MNQTILDACCGSRMMWFNKERSDVLFMDKRKEKHVLCDGRHLTVSPDVVADFTSMPFDSESFYLVVFDPPHMKSLGEKSWLAKKYGRLCSTWQIEIAEGFNECFRVLKPNGILIFKWNDVEIPLDSVIKLALPREPLFGHTVKVKKHTSTYWMTFMKTEGDR